MEPTELTSRKKSELLEKEIVSSSTLLFRATALAVIAMLSLWASGLMLRQYDKESDAVMYWRPAFLLVGWLGFVGVAYQAYVGLTRMNKAKMEAAVSVPCPYCGFENEFLGDPKADYDCESCHRVVHYLNGEAVPIITITCTFCKAVHKVSMLTRQYTCDRCNRSLRIMDPNDPKSVVVEKDDVLINYDVVLTDAGRNRNEVALALQDLLHCNLPDARKQMEAIPLIITSNVPERKADAIRRRMRELGASVIIRPTQQSEVARK